MRRTASPLVPGLGRAPHHCTHTTEVLAASASERSDQRSLADGIFMALIFLLD
jgi:hypothetical protein